MFTAGLFGGFGHCIGMCGPLIAASAFGMDKGSPAPSIVFHFGRVLSYSMVGGLMGFSGSFATVAKSIAHFQNLAMALAGVVMVFLGLQILGLVPRKTGGRHIFTDFMNRTAGRLSGTGVSSASFPLGIVIGFIPCGLSYTAYIAAAGAGAAADNHMIGFFKGATMLFLFGVGTIPALFLISRIVLLGNGRVRIFFSRVSAVLMMMIGILFVYRAVQS